MEALKVQYREYKAVKPGSYRAKIKAVEQKPSNFKEGEHVLVVEFELQNGEAGRVLRKTYGLRLGPRAKLTSLVTRLIGPLRDGQVVDLRELVGKECESRGHGRIGTGWQTICQDRGRLSLEGA
jgi:hypothetical protein